MMRPPVPQDEEERLQDLHELGLIGSAPEPIFDEIAALASRIAETPMSAITLIDADRQWLTARQGLRDGESAREHAFCSHAIMEPDRSMVVPDAREDPVFSDNPFVTGESQIRFYHGFPVNGRRGHPLGTLCVMDNRPRELTVAQAENLRILARITEQALRLAGARRGTNPEQR